MTSLKRVLTYTLSLTLLISLVVVGMASAADVELTWDANTEADLAGYRLYRSGTTGGPWTQIGNDIPAGDTSVIDTGLSDGYYHWVLTAFDDVGLESGYSNECMLKIDLTPPANPTGLRAFLQSLIAWLHGLFNLQARVIG